MSQSGKKIGILIEGDFYEKEIFYYEHRFPEEGIELHWLTRLWGQQSLTFYGHEYRAPFVCSESFENMSDAELRSYSAIIVPSAIVSDRLRYTEDVNVLPPATQFLKRAFARVVDPQRDHLPRDVAAGACPGAGSRPQGRSP